MGTPALQDRKPLMAGHDDRDDIEPVVRLTDAIDDSLGTIRVGEPSRK
jgi:hypothetical protein